MTSRKQTDKKEDENQAHRTFAEDERGWAGQHGQRPANEEERNYTGADTPTSTKQKGNGKRSGY